MSSDGFLDFGMGSGDDDIGKKAKLFKAESNHSYRVSFARWSTKGEKGWDDAGAFDKDGNLIPPVLSEEGVQTSGAQVRFIGCERLYLKGVGYVLYKGPAYAEFGQPKQYVATIICLWPTDKDGELDTAALGKGKYQIMPWAFSPDKYQTIRKSNRRFPIMDHDLLMSCPDNGAEFQKLTFTAEKENLLRRIHAKKSPLWTKIQADIKAVTQSINRDLAKDMTVDEIRQALSGEEGASPAGRSNHAAKDVDDLLKDVI